MANVLVIGKGGREHALVWKLKQSENVDRVYCIPGSDGIAEIANCADYNVNDFNGIAEFCKEMNIDLVVPGPEDPLCEGIVDYLTERGIKTSGPSKAAARLEGSKAFAKEFMRKHDIPTADFEVFMDPDKAKDYVEAHGAPIVIKADGLAAGKGSKVCMTLDEAINAVDSILVKKEFKAAGNKIVIEDYLEGEEASILALTDGNTIRTLAPAGDYKPAFETKHDRTRWLQSGGDRKYEDRKIGPNTGSLGAYAPTPIVTPELMEKVYNRILNPTIKGMAEEGTLFVGCLYAGLMIKDGEPSVLEDNVRFGDPETQPILSLLESDLFLLLNACVEGNLERHQIKNREGAACCVVMASGSYPGSNYEKGKVISGLEEVKRLSDVYVFHAGTKKNNGRIETDGGRVLGVNGNGDNIWQAINTVYPAVSLIHWENEYHRTDIAEKALS
jgi:phosphoribosylamine--glycine ligase